MAADRVLCSKPCSLQNPDKKSYTDGTLYVYQSLARFVSRGGAAQQRVEFPIDDIKGRLLRRGVLQPLCSACIQHPEIIKPDTCYSLLRPGGRRV